MFCVLEDVWDLLRVHAQTLCHCVNSMGQVRSKGCDGGRRQIPREEAVHHKLMLQ